MNALEILEELIASVRSGETRILWHRVRVDYVTTLVEIEVEQKDATVGGALLSQRINDSYVAKESKT